MMFNVPSQVVVIMIIITTYTEMSNFAKNQKLKKKKFELTQKKKIDLCNGTI